MGDGKVRRIAVIINGDTEDRHLKNVDRAAGLFKKSGYDLYVASPNKPQEGATVYVSPTSEGVGEIAKNLKGKIDDDDEIVIYTTGQGKVDGGGCLVLNDKCISKDDIRLKELLSLPSAKRTVVIGQPYGNNWAGLFSEDPKTLIISSGLRGARNDCTGFDSNLFGTESEIKAASKGGSSSWRLRYASAVAQCPGAQSAFAPGKNYRDKGIGGMSEEPPHFKAKVHEARTRVEYEKLLKMLRPGDVAVVTFAEDGCGACTMFQPQFYEMAKKNGGRELFIYIPNAPDKKQWGMIPAFPTVILADHTGRAVKVKDYYDPLSERWRVAAARWDDPEYCLSQLKKISITMKYFDPKLWKDKKFVLAAVQLDGRALQYADAPYKKNKDVVLAAVAQNGLAIEYADESFKKDTAMALLAIEQNPEAIKLIDTSLRDNRNFILSAVKRTRKVLQYVDNRYVKDDAFMLDAAKLNGLALEYADVSLKMNEKIVMAAVKENGRALQYADNSLKKKFAIVLAAVKKDGLALEFADVSLTKDRKIVMAALRRNTLGALVFVFVHPDLQKDPEIRKAAGLKD
jgi:thiol-disulfide isomerase/thioredoxin